MALLEKKQRLRKTSLLGMSILIHLLLIIIFAISNLTEKEKYQKIKLRVIKIAKVIKAKDKKSTKAKPKPKKKSVKKSKQKPKKTVKKAPRLSKAKKVKTTRMKKSKTKVEKTKLKVVKKLRLQQEKRTRRKLKKAKTIPKPKKMVQKKVAESKPKKVIKVVQKKKVFKKTEKKLKRSKAVPKKITTAMTFKTQTQKVQKLKRKVVKQRKSIIQSKVTPKFIPKRQMVKKQIVQKKVVKNKTIDPVQKTFKIEKKLPKKIEQKVVKRKIETQKNVKIHKVTPKQTQEFKAQKVRQQKVQKLNRVRQPVKTTKRVITKPRVTPRLNQPQKDIQKKVVKKNVTKPVKDFKPVRKKLTTKIEKQVKPKIKHKQVIRKHESLLAVEKTLSAPTMTTIELEKIEKPRVVKEIAQASRQQTTHKVTPTKTPRVKPTLNQPLKNIQKQVVEKEVTTPVKEFTPVRKQLVTKKATVTPVIKQEDLPRKHESQQVQKSKSTPTMTDVPIEEIVTEKPSAIQEVAQASRQVTHVATVSDSTPILTEQPVLDSVPDTQQTKQTTQAETSARSTDQPVEKEVEFEVATAVAQAVTPTEKAVTYQDKATTEVSVREVSELEPVEEFSPEAQTAVTTSIATSARSTTHVQSTMEESVVKVDLSQNEELPIADQSKTFTQADMTTDEGEEGDVEGKTIQTERLTDGTATATAFAAQASARPDFRGIDPSAAPSERKGKDGSSKAGPEVSVNIPSGNMTNEQLFNLSGAIDGDIRGAFVTVNGNTQIAVVEDGQLMADLTLVKGINEISVLAFNSGGGVGKRDFKLLYTPPQGVPTIVLESPENGKQGARANDPVIVEGTIDDHWITKAKLLLNGVPIALKVKKGRFKRKIYLPETRVTTFRIMATGRNGQTGYSSLHTVLIGYDIDIRNPRPY